MFVEPTYRRLTRTNGSLMKRLNQPNLYNRVVMASAWKFQISVLTVAASQPFQNFDSVLTRAIDPEKIRTVNFSLTRPNWFDLHVANVSLGSRDLFKNAFAVLKKSVMLRPIQRSLPTAPDTKGWSTSIQQKISPSVSFYKKFVDLTAVSVSSTPPTTVTDEGTISPNSFNPIFSEPTYSYIAQLQPEFFIPNLDQIKPDSAVVLQANSRFIEAYLAGLNQEMAVELLWRGFPADMNATFFRQFWDVSERTSVAGSDQSDILPIRQWAPTKALGTNGPLGSVPNPLVLVIKAELIKKYPTIAVYAHRAQKGADGFRRPDPAADAIKTPIFMAQLDPDFLLSGFALTADQVLGKSGGVDKDGWYFVLAERPGDMHFGMDLDGSQAPATWNDLNWGLLPPNVTMLDLDIHKPTEPTTNRSIHWGKGLNATADDPTSGTGDAAQMASILQQKPFRVFFHASTLLPNS
ncbi:hypothetical protein GO730_32860 [Spirosoma sp. HMF3257]|uniref:Uncharacterized protein n=1 Tax=Spirosoma telluris TaxID=2183553 RepID=A0A327NQK5_9BACT|nr:hypothetical protein [Spirosoma telluris]RAI77721.1 hypothetical protein HMF3257_32765 [Spirosoma telluris]